MGQKKPQPGDRAITTDEEGDLVEMTVTSVNEYKVTTDNEAFPELTVRWSKSEDAWVDEEVEIGDDEDEEVDE